MIQIQRSGGYTVLPNGILRDTGLSLKTKGLFAIILSLPDRHKSKGGTKMKKLLSLAVALGLALSLAACGGGTTTDEESPAPATDSPAWAN